MDLITTIRYVFLSAAGAVLLIQFIPAFRTRFLAYGKTAEPLAPGYKDHKAPPDKTAVSLFLDTVATIRVPHGWFTHFYVACVACNLFWGCQIVTHGAVYQWFSSFVGAEEEWKEGGKAGGKAVVGGQTVHQVVVVWALLLIQGSRRLYECVYVTAPGTSKMWVGHYLLGIAFYIAMSVAIWVEGTVAINQFRFTPLSIYNLVGPPSTKSFFGILIFIFASGVQHDCHVYLASLKRYTLPKHLAFNSLICPHYSAECMTYLALAILSAPRGRGVVLNTTMVTGMLFVVVTLGCSSLLSREWYEEKFGRHTVEHRWNMIPFVF